MGLLKILCLLPAAVPLFAGGCWLDFGNPRASRESLESDVIVTVREFCLGGTIREARIVGTAEGLVDRHRVSKPLIIVNLLTPGLHAVRWKRPASGVWVLSFLVDDGAKYVDPKGRTGAVMTGALVVLRPEGVERQPKLLDHRPMATEVDGLLCDLSLAGAR